MPRGKRCRSENMSQRERVLAVLQNLTPHAAAGLVVDTKVVHPVDFSFFLNSHAGLQVDSLSRSTPCCSSNILQRDQHCLGVKIWKHFTSVRFQACSWICSEIGSSPVQGTSRPCHYHVLLDQAKMSADELQNFTNR